MNAHDDISNHSGPGSAAEPSMEEILASIRRILKEDEGQMTSDPAMGDEEVLVLDATMRINPADISTATELPAETGVIQTPEELAPPSPPEPWHFSSEPSPGTRQDAPSAAQAQPQAEPEPEIILPPAAPEQEDFMEEHLQSPQGLIGDDLTDSISSTIGSLVRSISTDRAVSVSRGGLTLEDIVREEIKPILKAWFDTHLPSLVERIVRAEIGRVVDRTQL